MVIYYPRFITHLKEGSLVGLADGLHVDDVDEEDEGELQECDKAQHRGEEQAHPADSLTRACFFLLYSFAVWQV